LLVWYSLMDSVLSQLAGFFCGLLLLSQVIPRQLCDNAGFDATDMLNKLRQKHALADGSGKVGRVVQHVPHHMP
jgi:T-complex protein 1 subunit eta